jgi:Tol biopolymer transport system component
MTRLSRFALSLAVMAALAALLAPVACSWPGANGAIVFEAFLGGGGEEPGRGSGIKIAPLGADRTQIASLTTDPGDSDPQASPDGRQVVFVRSSDPESFGSETKATIYLINTDGTGLRQLTDGLHTDGEPAFSALGDRVYFTRLLSTGVVHIFSVRLNGGGLLQITSGGADEYHPRTSARTGLLTFERRVVGPHSVRYHHVFVSRANGSRPRDLTPNLSNRVTAADPEFSPDGKRIAYSIGDRLLSVRTNGTGRRLLVPSRGGFSMTFRDPTYAPDGRSLIFTIGTGRTSLHRIDLRRLRALPRPLVEPHIGARSPAWLAQPRRR